MIEYRKEYKIIFSRRELGEIFNFYQGIETIYQPRNISSVYMDTKKFDIYRENLFNDAEKSKLRFRQYNEEGQVYKEIKVSNLFGKSKLVEKTDFKSLDDIKEYWYQDRPVYPTSLISYKREYFKFKNLRITIDSEISYLSTTLHSLINKSIEKNICILEIKLLNEKDRDVEKYFYKQPEAFSKYIDSIKLLYPKSSQVNLQY
jgi:hypothetical protein